MHKVITPARVRSQGCRSGEQQVVGPAGGAGEEGCLKAGADTLGSVSKSSLAPITQMTTIAVHNFKWGTRFWQKMVKDKPSSCVFRFIPSTIGSPTRHSRHSPFGLARDRYFWRRRLFSFERVVRFPGVGSSTKVTESRSLPTPSVQPSPMPSNNPPMWT